MAKQSKIETNNMRKRMALRDGEKRAALKKVVMDRSLSMEDRFVATLKLAKLPRNGAKIRVRNRCEFSGRPHAYYRKLGLSRIALREMGSSGLIPGLVKSSW